MREMGCEGLSLSYARYNAARRACHDGMESSAALPIDLSVSTDHISSCAARRRFPAGRSARPHRRRPLEAMGGGATGRNGPREQMNAEEVKKESADSEMTVFASVMS